MLKCFLEALKVQGRSEKTIERYRYILERMLKAVGVPTRRVNVYHLRTYIAAEKARGIKDATLESNRQIYSSYFGWLQREGLIEKNPIANMGVIKVPKKEKQTFTDVDLDNLKNACKCARDRAIVMFLAATGCRISEVVALNRSDIDFVNLRCVVHGKGNKERMAFFDNVTAVALQRYLAERHDFLPELFSGKRGRLSADGVRSMLNDLADRAGVEHVHPHKFRRTFATELARHGMPIQRIMAVLGHESIDTTMGYVVQNVNEVDNDYRRYAM